MLLRVELLSLLCPASTAATVDDLTSYLDRNGVDAAILTGFQTVPVPISLPLTRNQYQACLDHWPVQFHEDKWFVWGRYINKYTERVCSIKVDKLSRLSWKKTKQFYPRPIIQGFFFLNLVSLYVLQTD